MLILCTVRLQAVNDRPAFMSPLPNVLWQQISPSAMCPGEWQPHHLPLPSSHQKSQYFQAGSPLLPKTFAVSLTVASQCRDDLPCILTKTALQPGNAFPLPRHFLSSHLPWRPSCLCETKTDSEAHSVFPSHYSSTISTSAEIHLPPKYLASFKFSFFRFTPSLYLILLFLCARQSF